jgi:hypothetical protein
MYSVVNFIFFRPRAVVGFHEAEEVLNMVQQEFEVGQGPPYSGSDLI